MLLSTASKVLLKLIHVSFFNIFSSKRHEKLKIDADTVCSEEHGVIYTPNTT